jgi:glutamate synthase (NADPH/NADH) small chain
VGKPTGFLEYAREAPGVRPALERLRDWGEFHRHLPEPTLREQGARCMDCGLPFCHTGEVIGGMASGCPLHNLIPDWNDLVFRGRWREALLRLHQTNDFPEFTGRVCPAPCEGSCVLGLQGAPVTIKAIEAAIADRGFEEGWVVAEPPPARTGRSVAVVGSGPAGLACASQLNRAGHHVTVFERADRPGGLLVYGIPSMKLDKGLVERRVRLMEEEGVRFVTGAHIGRDVAAADLRDRFDALVLCGGATAARDMAVDGRGLAGVHLAMEYLEASARSLLDAATGEPSLSARGRDVVVIGGGDTGTDCVGTALRQGCRSLAQLEILPRPPLERAPDNPWPQWPRVYRMDYGQEEAAARFGGDPRRYAVTTRAMLGDGSGHVRAVRTMDLDWVKGQGGRLETRERPGTEHDWPAQLVLLALGFTGPERHGMISQLGVRLDARGNVATDERRRTSAPGVFAAGDMARGQSLVVWAIAEGRRAARGVDAFLMGDGLRP